MRSYRTVPYRYGARHFHGNVLGEPGRRHSVGINGEDRIVLLSQKWTRVMHHAAPVLCIAACVRVALRAKLFEVVTYTLDGISLCCRSDLARQMGKHVVRDSTFIILIIIAPSRACTELIKLSREESKATNIRKITIFSSCPTHMHVRANAVPRCD